jgi:hypothetical protein
VSSIYLELSFPLYLPHLKDFSNLSLEDLGIGFGSPFSLFLDLFFVFS